MCWISDLFFFFSDCSFYSYDGVFLSMLPPLHPHHCQSCCYRSEGYFLLVDSASCVCFSVFILLVLVLVLLGRDIDIGILAHDLRHMTWEIRTWKYGKEYFILHRTARSLYFLFDFFCPFLKKRCAYRCCVFIILLRSYTVCNAMCCLCLP